MQRLVLRDRRLSPIASLVSRRCMAALGDAPHLVLGKLHLCGAIGWPRVPRLATEPTSLPASGKGSKSQPLVVLCPEESELCMGL